MATNGPLIRRLRREAGWSVRDLATRAAVNPGYLSRVERGEAEPTTRWVDAVAGVFAIPVKSLLLPDDGEAA